MQTDTITFVNASQLIPNAWSDWFWEAFSEDAPFSWGDKGYSLIAPINFLSHAYDVFDKAETQDDAPIEGKEEFIQSILDLGTTYINLED